MQCEPKACSENRMTAQKRQYINRDQRAVESAILQIISSLCVHLQVVPAWTLSTEVTRQDAFHAEHWVVQLEHATLDI